MKKPYDIKEELENKKPNHSSPLTDKSFGISIERGNKFYTVKQQALDEYIIRKTRRDKRNSISVPLKYPGELAVISTENRVSKNKEYLAVEIIDFIELPKSRNSKINFKYYGIVLSVTSEHLVAHVGHIIDFEDSSLSWWSSRNCYKLESFDVDKIKWLATKG